jgi:N-methylhydantoinase A
MARQQGTGWRLGVDVGGTFTDLILSGPKGEGLTRKVLSTPPDYARGILDGVRELLDEAKLAGADISELIHGTTVATNAILERRGARTALITTEGFRDLLEIGRLRLSRLYDLDHQRPIPLARRRWRLEVRERLRADGAVMVPLDMATVEQAVDTLIAEKVEAVAVCLMHAYVDPTHERRIGEVIRRRAPDIHLSLSSEVLPEIREYERTSTTVTNGYVMPVMARYIETLEHGIASLGLDASIFIMQSSGGMMTASRARRFPVQLIESGPAAGVIAAAGLARRAALPNVISMDMGGTTAKASVIEDYAIRSSHEFEIGGPISQGSRLNKGGGYLLRTPAIDIAEVGAGGGSIVTVDGSGALRVGPRSAGAAPGPACYALGGNEATLTDANVVLGYLAPDRLPSGLALDAGAARRVIEQQVGAKLGLGLEDAAHGVYLVGCAGLARAVRAVTVERGRDPREFAMIAFGGNGPLYAAELARSLEIATVIVPPAPGVFSAVGLLEAQLEQSAVRTRNKLLAEDEPAALLQSIAELRDQARMMMRDEGYSEGLAITAVADLRYVGQSYELGIVVPENMRAAALMAHLGESFGREHERTYGHRSDNDPIQIVNLRVTARITAKHAPPATSLRRTAPSRSRRAYFGKRLGVVSVEVIDREALGPAWRAGPFLVDEYDATTLVPPGCRAHRDSSGNIVIAIEEES